MSNNSQTPAGRAELRVHTLSAGTGRVCGDCRVDLMMVLSPTDRHMYLDLCCEAHRQAFKDSIGDGRTAR